MRDFVAYMDASGTHDGSSVVAFTGLLSTARMWARFSRTWNAALRRSPRPVAVFHMAEFFSAKGDFAGWTHDDRQALMTQLGPTISAAAVLAFGTLVRTDHYRTFLTAEAQTVCGSPVDLCFGYALSQLRNWIVSHKNLAMGDRMTVVIDRDDKPRMERWRIGYSDFRARFDVADRLASEPLFGSRALHPPLQAADVIAHQMFQHIRDGIIERGQIRECLRWSLGGVPNDIGLLEPHNLLKHEMFLRSDGLLSS